MIDRAQVCACGHARACHQFQGTHANWPCNGPDGTIDSCDCNGFAPLDGHDPYLVEHLQAAPRSRVDPRHFSILWEPGQLARHRTLARRLPRAHAIDNS